MVSRTDLLGLYQFCQSLGTYLINLGYTWEKLSLAARAIAAVDNPADVCVVSARPYAQRALLKFAAHTGGENYECSWEVMKK